MFPKIFQLLSIAPYPLKVYAEPIEGVETANNFTGNLYVGDLVFADGDEKCVAWFAIHDDVGGLQAGVAEEAVSVEILAGDVFDLFLVGGDALEPAERGDHAKEEMEFGVFGDERLLEDDGFLRVEAGGEIVGDDFDGVLRDGGSVGVVGGEGVPVGDEVEAVVIWIVLQANPVFQRAEIVADVEFAGWAHAAEDALFGCGV